MKSIMQKLYYGNISSPKDIRIPEKTRKKEAAIYEKLKATLSEESDKLFERIRQSICRQLRRAYACSLQARAVNGNAPCLRSVY